MEEICRDLQGEHDALDAVVADLTEEEWSGPTLAEGWDVKETIVHLIQADHAAFLSATDPDAFAAALEAAMRGEGLEVFGSSEGKSGADVLAWWRQQRTDMVDALAARGPKDRLPWFGPDMGAKSFATARLMETWAHGRDIADAVGADIPPSDRLRHVADIGVRTRGWSYINRRLTPPEAEVRVELAAPSGDRWDWGPAEAADRVTGTALDFCLVVTQRRHVDDTALVASGPAATEWLELAQAFAGPPTDVDTARRQAD
ncbi:MAG: TIGR03084 family metal-binding protein [Actinomycetota bacterium]